MRSLVLGTLGLMLVGATSRAVAAPTQPALVDVEVRAGMGLEVGSSGGNGVVRPSAMTFGARAAFMIRDEPATWAYIGGMTETGGRSSSGLLAGVRLRPAGRIRLGAGGLWVVRPYSLFGAITSIGACAKATGTMHLCGDLEGTFLFGGTDLPTQHTVTQVQLVLGVRFDAM